MLANKKYPAYVHTEANYRDGWIEAYVKIRQTFRKRVYPGTIIEVRWVDRVSSGPLSAPLSGYQLLKILFLQRSRIQIGTVYESGLILKQMLPLVPLLERTKSDRSYINVKDAKHLTSLQRILY